MVNKTLWTIAAITTIIAMIAVLILSTIYLGKEIKNELKIKGEIVKVDGCEPLSNSMSPIAICNDKAIIEKIDKETKLEIGQIYVYIKEEEAIFHRLIACKDEKCEYPILIGENNRIAETINRTQITHKVKGIIYE